MDAGIGAYLLGLKYLFNVLALVLPIFLFWRAARHELVDSESAFDVVFVALFAGILAGRITFFLFHPEIFNFSVARFFFITTYGGIDYFGALVGVLVAAFVLVGKKANRFWEISDLAIAPITFGLFLHNISLSILSTAKLKYLQVPESFVYVIYYFCLYFVLKRLTTKKRYLGFFASFGFTAIGAATFFHYFVSHGQNLIYQKYPYSLLWGGALFTFGLVSLYILSKKSVREDIARFFTSLFLGLLRIRRMITSADEAGRLSRTILFSPYFLIRSLYVLISTICKEIVLGIVDFYKVFKVKK